MGQITDKMRVTTHGFAWWCPGCDEMHPLPHQRGWTWDGNLDKPTFTPSFKHEWNAKFDEVDERGIGIGSPRHYVCHYIITAGKVAFCGDCTHAMAGQTIDMPDLPPEYQDDYRSSELPSPNPKEE